MSPGESALRPTPPRRRRQASARSRRLPVWCAALLAAVSLRAPAVGREAAPAPATAPPAGPRRPPETVERGLEVLLTRRFLPADLDEEIVAELWTTWEEPSRSRAERAAPDERRRMTFERYGLTPRPDDPRLPMQYVVAADGSWTMNCLACHQGQVEGRVIPGLPNSNYALETLTEEVRAVKLRQRKPFGHMDLGSLILPLGTTNGTTNAVMFGVALMRHRAADLSIVQRPPRFDLVHHDMDAPPWWHYATRRSLYADGFAPKGHRMLMQFLLVKENGPERFREWEGEFRDVENWITSLRPPKWPWAIDEPRARRGAAVFAANCRSCHGTPGSPDGYPERLVGIDDVGTDRMRLDALSARERGDLNRSWFAHMGADASGLEDRTAPGGYVAPPLDGIWATAPYLHNGSVPTLWHLLRPDDRPRVWRRSAAGYDHGRVGLQVEEFDALPAGPLLPAERRRHFDTTRPGKGAGGHDFPAALDDGEKADLLEYLKTI